MAEQAYFIGLISGTSVDGIDCVLVDFSSDQPLLVASLAFPFRKELRQQIVDLCQQPLVPLASLGEANIAIGLQFAEAVNELLARENLDAGKIAAIGSHGQTIYHKPGSPYPFTLQIGDPNTIAYQTGITTVADFRGKDMAAGGQGAPLAPLFHRFVFESASQDRVIVNLGGIANISVIARNSDYLGYDTGPANVLMDYWIEKHKQQPMDRNGAWAASGQVIDELLTILLDDSYFIEAEPKSTGREYFNGTWLEERLIKLQDPPRPADVQATLLELTASSVATEIENQLNPHQVVLCGGGAYNITLVQRLQELLPNSQVISTAELDIPPEWVEAMTFAWLAKQRLENIASDTATITGATREVVLGGVYLPG